uniref:RNase H type-1 domain-containing protein n=1 Tax=Setaria italica TaxID=4555 RepID=K3YYR3_SETIT
MTISKFTCNIIVPITPRISYYYIRSKCPCHHIDLRKREVAIHHIKKLTDCLELVKLWETIDAQRSAVNLILRDIRNISRSFGEFTFVYATRTCNRVAHVSARQVSHDHVAEEWHGNPLLVLRDLLASDCNQVLT